MRFFKRLRPRFQKDSISTDELQQYPRPRGPDRLTTLPQPVLARIFQHVCPHSTDSSYRASEDTLFGTCGLCDLKDLTSCALVNRTCYMTIQDVLYCSVRIDAVHFCPRELELAETRRKKRVDPSSIVPTRMRLFQRTAWARPDLAANVLFFRSPFMAREAYSLDLARTVAALPNLRHIDLPQGFFSADASLCILRQEVASKCWDLRRMKFSSGAQAAFESLLTLQTWPNIEVLELEELDVDVATLRRVLATLPALVELKLTGLPRLDDTAFHSVPYVPDMPPLLKLTVESAPGVTFNGLSSYVARPETSRRLRHLSLQDTAVSPQTMHKVLRHSTGLTHLSITETVDRSFPLDLIPPLASPSLKTLTYEIVAKPNHSRPPTRASALEQPYYSYLASSLLSNGLPALTKLFVRDPSFAATLLAPRQPSPDTASQPRNPTPRSNPASIQPLELFTKGPEDSDWTVSAVGEQRHSPRPRSRDERPPPAHTGRPVSAYMVTQGSAAPAWRGAARKSVLVGNGQGGFLAVPGMAADDEDDLVPVVPEIPKAWEGTLERRVRDITLD